MRVPISASRLAKASVGSAASDQGVAAYLLIVTGAIAFFLYALAGHVD